MMVGGVQISDVDEAVVALKVDENGRVKRVSYCVVRMGHFSRVEGSLLRSFRNADDGTVVVRGVSRPARTRLGREKPARRC